MTPLVIRRETLLDPVNWEPAGQSPSNSPGAMLQQASQLIGLANDPATGLDKHALTKAILQNGGLRNAKNVQRTKEELVQSGILLPNGQLAPPPLPPGAPGSLPPLPPSSGAAGI